MRNIQHQRIKEALDMLESGIASPSALNILPSQAALLRKAADRVEAQLSGPGEPALTIALAGCTGSGKSTLINALAGAPIAAVSERRPCTTGIKVYHHQAVSAGGLFRKLSESAAFVPHERPELRFKVIVDTPDLDTFATNNRALTRALLKAAGLVIYVFSPERYLEERAWSVIREERRFSRSIAVLNKSDTVTPDTLEKISSDIRARFSEMGSPDVKLLRLSAAANTPGASGDFRHRAPSMIDEFASLKAYIEFELREGEVFRMLRRQRIAVVDALGERVEEIVRPGEVGAGIDRLTSVAEMRRGKTADELVDILKIRMSAITSQLEPQIIIRKHQRFWGPFRVWLAVSDFLSYRLPQLVRGIRFAGTRGDGSIVEKALRLDYSDQVDDVISAEALELQGICHGERLPLERWRAITGKDGGGKFLLSVAREVETKFEGLAEDASTGGRIMAWFISMIAFLLPAGLAVFGTYMLINDALNGEFAGFGILGTVAVITLLGYVHLHVITAMVFRAGGPASSRRAGEMIVRKTVERVFDGWLKSYRYDIAADISKFEGPLRILAEVAPFLPAPGGAEEVEAAAPEISTHVESDDRDQPADRVSPAESLKLAVEKLESD